MNEISEHLILKLNNKGLLSEKIVRVIIDAFIIHDYPNMEYLRAYFVKDARSKRNLVLVSNRSVMMQESLTLQYSESFPFF